MLNAGKIATGMKPNIYILFLFSVLPHTPPTRQRRPWGTSTGPALLVGSFLRGAGRKVLSDSHVWPRSQCLLVRGNRPLVLSSYTSRRYYTKQATYHNSQGLQNVKFAHRTGTMFTKPGIHAGLVENMPIRKWRIVSEIIY